MPLGSGAIAGHAFRLDRTALAADLGFSGGPSPNSMDAVVRRRGTEDDGVGPASCDSASGLPVPTC